MSNLTKSELLVHNPILVLHPAFLITVVLLHSLNKLEALYIYEIYL